MFIKKLHREHFKNADGGATHENPESEFSRVSKASHWNSDLGKDQCFSRCGP